MTIGEKIKCFRTLKNMTQRTLGELTGIGEATIRKYELGIRNPKPAQLKKIAQVLEIGENIFLEIPLTALSVETIGDVMAILFLLESRVGITYSGYQKKNGTLDPSTLMLHFESEKVNDLIVQWLKEKQDLNNGTNYVKEIKEKYTPKKCNTMTTIDASLHHVTRQTFIENKDLLEDNKEIYSFESRRYNK